MITSPNAGPRKNSRSKTRKLRKSRMLRCAFFVRSLRRQKGLGNNTPQRTTDATIHTGVSGFARPILRRCLRGGRGRNPIVKKLLSQTICTLVFISSFPRFEHGNRVQFGGDQRVTFFVGPDFPMNGYELSPAKNNVFNFRVLGVYPHLFPQVGS